MTDVTIRTDRRKSARDAVRRFNRRVLNPAMMKLAGRRHWYASAIRHRGRRSGREYVTPVVASPTEEGFVVPLPYGEGVDWLRNVLAAGRAEIETGGTSVEVAGPEVVGAETAFPLVAERHRRAWRLFGIERYLVVRRAQRTGVGQKTAESTGPRRRTVTKKKWSDLSGRQRAAILTATSVQVSLLLTALIDIYRRPAREIRGGKRVWAAVSFVNFVGPISYFAFGRKR